GNAPRARQGAAGFAALRASRFALSGSGLRASGSGKQPPCDLLASRRLDRLYFPEPGARRPEPTRPQAASSRRPRPRLPSRAHREDGGGEGGRFDELRVLREPCVHGVFVVDEIGARIDVIEGALLREIGEELRIRLVASEHPAMAVRGVEDARILVIAR